MIGGTVIEVIQLPDKIWLNCKDTPHSRSECAVYTSRTAKSEAIKPGDRVWWQSGRLMWTPSGYVQNSGKSGRDFDIVLDKIGGSGVKRPELKGMEL